MALAKTGEYKGQVIAGENWNGPYSVTNFIWPYLHQFFDDSHGLKTSLKPSKRPFD